MPRVAIPVTSSAENGTALPAETAGDATNDHYIPSNDGKIILLARNSGAVARTVTIKTPKQVGAMDVAENVKSIPAGETHVFGPFDPSTYNQSAAGDEDELHIDPEHAEVLMRAIHLG